MDTTDRALLALLSRNARITNRELAAKVGLSPSSCLERVRRLEETGTILGYRAILAQKPSGGAIEGWAGIRLLEPSSEATIQLLQAIRESATIVEAHQIAGPYDYTLRFISPTINEWREFQAQLQNIGCATHARVSILVDQIK